MCRSPDGSSTSAWRTVTTSPRGSRARRAAPIPRRSGRRRARIRSCAPFERIGSSAITRTGSGGAGLERERGRCRSADAAIHPRRRSRARARRRRRAGWSIDRAVVDARRADRSESAAPGLVRREDLGHAVLLVDLELREHADAVAVDRGAAGEPEAPAVPAVADGGHDHVVALVQQGGDIDGVDEHPLLVRGPAGGEQRVGDAHAVDPGIDEAEGAEPQPRRAGASPAA